MSAKLLSDERVSSLNGDQKELVQSISDDAERLLQITGELLNMSQVETGNIQLKIQPTGAGEIVSQAVNTVQSQAQQKGISINTVLQDGLPPVNADREKTSWVLINFLSNAIKFSNGAAAVEINVYKKYDCVEFIVKDFGPGIDPKYIPKIFDRYFKVPGQDQSGTGLGLAISKEFIEAQHGHIWVSSQLGEGSVFAFSLPIS
jgi:signal transduction histidine kinase